MVKVSTQSKSKKKTVKFCSSINFVTTNSLKFVLFLNPTFDLALSIQRFPLVTDAGDENMLGNFQIASTELDCGGALITAVALLTRTCNFCLKLFTLLLHLAAHIHLYSAELLESLSDKTMKERVREGWIWRGRSNSTTMMKVSLPRAAPDLSCDTQ